mmetsp:Transcript_29028/g.81209  ORF Transcript_29028/g.81209 Transcript_29028/m.81209 type:complete len:208 (-) Transcript_29028:449-1072(-)
MEPSDPLTRRRLSTVRDRTFSCEPGGRPSMIFSHSGFIFTPAHHTHMPKGTQRSTPEALSAMVMTPSPTLFTALLSTSVMLARRKCSVAYSARRRSYVLSTVSMRSTIWMSTYCTSSGGYSRATSSFTMSYTSAASSTPVGPAPTTRKVRSSRTRWEGVPGMTARSKRSMMLWRTRAASGASLKNRQCSSTPGMPNVLGTAPTPTTR